MMPSRQPDFHWMPKARHPPEMRRPRGRGGRRRGRGLGPRECWGTFRIEGVFRSLLIFRLQSVVFWNFSRSFYFLSFR